MTLSVTVTQATTKKIQITFLLDLAILLKMASALSYSLRPIKNLTDSGIHQKYVINVPTINQFLRAILKRIFCKDESDWLDKTSIVLLQENEDKAHVIIGKTFIFKFLI